MPEVVWETPQAGPFELWRRQAKAVRNYYLLLWLVLVALVMLILFFPLPLTLTVTGRVRPICEETQVMALQSGKLEAIEVRSGQRVQAGAVVIRINDRHGFAARQWRAQFMARQRSRLRQLELLLRASAAGRIVNTQVPVIFEFEAYTQQRLARRLAISRLDSLIAVQEKLAASNAAVPAERRELLWERQRLQAENRSWEMETRAGWQKQVQALEASLFEQQLLLNSQLESHEFSVLRAPVQGRVLLQPGLYAGSPVTMGQPLFTVIPDTTLVVEAEVSVPLAARLRKGQQVTLEAADQPVWNLQKIEGRVWSLEPAGTSNQPVIRLRCMPLRGAARPSLTTTLGTTSAALHPGAVFNCHVHLGSGSLFRHRKQWIYGGKEGRY